MKRHEILLAGTGGQGVVLAGLMLAEAAAVHDGRNVAQAPSYGIEARGGAVRSELVISDEPIDFPHVTHPNILIALSQQAYDQFSPGLVENALLVTDSVHVHAERLEHAYPITAIAEQATGRAIAANVVALGVLVALTGLVSRRAIAKAVWDRSPPGSGEANLRALRAGWQAVADRELHHVTSAQR